MTIYIVCGDEGDRETIVAVFSNQAKADRYADIRGVGYFVVSMAVDEMDDDNLKKGVACFRVYIDKYKILSSYVIAEPDFKHAGKEPHIYKTLHSNRIEAIITVIAKNKGEAVQLADLERVKLVNNGAFDLDGKGL